MLMVDELIYIDDEKVETLFCIKPDCVFVNNNIFVEAGLIENAAQTCSAIVGKGYFDDDDLEGKNNKLIGFISAIKTTNIYKLPSANDKIVTKSNLISKFDAGSYTICTMDCEISIASTIIADFVMNLFIQEAV